MEYERIHKVQMGVMSPTKLRMKLLGSHSHGSGSSSSKDEASKSPARLAVDGDDDHPKNSLLAQELDEEYPKDRSDSSRSRSGASHGRAAHAGGNGNGYDSGHDGNFEFYKQQTAAQQQAAAVAPVVGAFFRQVPSKWNDAEKWIAARHVVHSNPIFSKKAAALAGHGHGGGVRVTTESVKSGGSSAGSALTELTPPSPPSSASVSSSSQHKKVRVAATAPVVVVSTRDVGTEMTPMASQEQSRSGTPAGAATPSLLSPPLCSVPSSPRGSELELRLRTRREIAALGLQLGKMSIASWASKDDLASPAKCPGGGSGGDGGGGEAKRREEFEACAVAWQESQKRKLSSRYERKEARIQEWESCQRAKFEAKSRHAEVQAEQLKARAKQKLSKRLVVLSHKVEGKQARAEARRSRRAARLARQVDRIRDTGRAPPSSSRLRRCCSWFL